MSDAAPRVVGLIADTHGLVRPQLHDALAGVELILHAGDVGEGVLDELALIAPVAAVRGNTDPAGDPRLPAELVRELGGVSIHVSHGHETGSPTPAKLLARYPHDVLVFGHTHRQLVARAEGGSWSTRGRRARAASTSGRAWRASRSGTGARTSP
jgi:putative phosphoesterase